MSDIRQPHREPERLNEEEGVPKQAVSGGGSHTRAGSLSGGSAPGDEPDAPLGGVKPSVEAASWGGAGAETPSFTSPDGAETDTGETVNNTGEPRQMRNRQDLEDSPGDDVDAATG